ncbi:hypothetical protein NEILACOT_03405 [Neisseria lactamica ATCC 23970]|uniref:Uncharacterized protein n=1 Tax=Neisseria lactamica ATCC 23970 TaxID=546265 RepID=D0W7A8_NEILA|nr:hypothetical protein NEILACOT_03405 [Neisseria lactamica ATCC 23970]
MFKIQKNRLHKQKLSSTGSAAIIRPSDVFDRRFAIFSHRLRGR